MSSILTSGLPDGVEIGGRKYKIHTSFRNWLEIDRILFDTAEELPEEGAPLSKRSMEYITALCYKELPKNLSEAYSGMIAFYQPDEERKKNAKNHEKRQKKNEKISSGGRGYSFYYDADAVFADFLRFYNINLAVQDLHWHEFRALFYNLPSESRIKQIINIRTIKLSDIKDKKERAKYRELKEIWALPDNRSEKVKENEFADGLW